MEHWFDRTEAGRVEWAQRLGLPRFRARQLDTHLFSRLEDSPDEWTDIPKPLREKLQAECLPPLLAPVTTLTADQGATVKSLWRLPDGVLVEGVLMRYGVKGLPASGRGDERATLCLSCQAGCAMGCPFCATGQGGLRRNLTASEMLMQVFQAAQALARGELPGGFGRLSNIVFMGMGEPMANLPNVLTALQTITAPAPAGFGISARSITVSTVGLTAGIRRLAASGIPATLAISLHAPDDKLRDELCPVNKRIPIREVLDAAHQYFEQTGRRVSIEYALIRDVNDQPWRAERLANILDRGGHAWAHVNLIPLNPTPGSKWTASRPEAEAEFKARLEAGSVAVTIRDTRGSDIDGACGQLAAAQPGL